MYLLSCQLTNVGIVVHLYTSKIFTVSGFKSKLFSWTYFYIKLNVVESTTAVTSTL